MPRNIEIKAFVSSLDEAMSVAAKLADCATPTLIKQWDVFFNVPTTGNRLKLRQIEGDEMAKLIAYSRSDQEGPKLSDYHITFTKEGDQLRETLTRALGILGEVNYSQISQFVRL